MHINKTKQCYNRLKPRHKSYNILQRYNCENYGQTNNYCTGWSKSCDHTAFSKTVRYLKKFKQSFFYVQVDNPEIEAVVEIAYQVTVDI